jgi:hypothetical protein
VNHLPADVLDNRCTLYISSCDAYSDLWEPFFILFNKYWPDCPYPIVLASETKTFSYPGLNIHCPRFYQPGEPSPWGERNIRTLQSIDSPFIFFMLEDFFLFAPTDQPFIAKSVDWMESDQDIGKFQWRRGSWISNPGKYAPYGLVSRSEHVRVCAFPALWRRDTLIKSMKPRESPWEWEKKGTVRSKAWREKLYDTPYYPIKYPWGGVLWHGRWCKQGGAIVRMNGIPMDFSRRGILSFKRRLWPQDDELIELYKEWQAAKRPKLGPVRKNTQGSCSVFSVPTALFYEQALTTKP